MLIDELEARFGTKKPITQIQFDAVIAKLKSLGFALENLTGTYRLTIQSEYDGAQIQDILKFLTYEQKLVVWLIFKSIVKKILLIWDTTSRIARNVVFVQKNRKMMDDTALQAIDFEDFGFRINYKTESKRNKHLKGY